MKEQVLVSVGIPTYNGEKTIYNAILSVLNQNHTNIELIISDNASTDRTKDICNDFEKKDSRVKYFRQEVNVGPAANFEFVLTKSAGNYFMWLGDDDWIDPDYIEKCLNILATNKEYGLVSGSCSYYKDGNYFMSGDKIIIDQDNPCKRIISYLQNVSNNHIFYGLYRKNIINNCIIENVFGEDWIIISTIAKTCKIKTIPDTFIHRTYRPKSSFDYVKDLQNVGIVEKLIPNTYLLLRLYKKTFRNMHYENNPLTNEILAVKMFWTISRRFIILDINIWNSKLVLAKNSIIEGIRHFFGKSPRV